MLQKYGLDKDDKGSGYYLFSEPSEFYIRPPKVTQHCTFHGLLPFCTDDRTDTMEEANEDKPALDAFNMAPV